MLDELARALDELDRRAAPAVARFDTDAALTGHVAVLPSAFNPPTEAHLALLATARDAAGHGTVAALLSTRNVAKDVFGAGLEHRVGMLLAAREDAPGLAVLAANAARLADQGAALREAFPGAAFDFVVGFDTLVRLFDPRYYEDMAADLDAFFAAHRALATNRGEITVEGVHDFLRQPFAARYASRIEVVELGERPASLSSTLAREAAAAGREPEMVPPAVRRYIKRFGLYGSPGAN